jgi:Tfp pilus assembly PilM family ATPase
MFSFLKKTRSYLGVDIGTANIKVVELTSGVKVPPRNYGRAEYTVTISVDAARDVKG